MAADRSRGPGHSGTIVVRLPSPTLHYAHSFLPLDSPRPTLYDAQTLEWGRRDVQRNSATIKDIAREVGMDYSTVSLALRDHPRIAVGTRQRIQEAAEHLGYVPNRAAQALRLGRSHTIAFVLWGDNSEQIRQSFPDYTLAATAAAFAAGYELLLLQATAARLAAAGIDRFPELRQTDGALFVGETLDRQGLAALLQAGYPVVHLGERTLEGVTLPCVGADYAQGGALAAEHLLSFGHRRLAALYGPHSGAPEIHERRLAGFEVGIRRVAPRARDGASRGRRMRSRG